MTTHKEKAFQLFDAENAQDPHRELKHGMPYAKELLYAERMTEMLAKFAPQASEAVQLAARAQHLRRWEIARSGYAMNRVGYLKWRTELKEFHATKATECLNQAGYSNDIIFKVRALIKKDGLKTNPDAQLLEDVICLVFLQFYFEDFAKKHDEDKIVSIVQKTWKKMSAKGQKFALTLPLSQVTLALVGKALVA